MIRPAAVAGAFYPADAAILRQTVSELSGTGAAGASLPKALIVPHAGYVYSGAIAGAAYARLRPFAATVRRVILLGPAHRVAVRGLALPDPAVERFATPLGEVAVDREAVRRLHGLPQVGVSDPAHAREHALEVQLPFLQSVLGDFTLVPLVVGDASVADVAAVLECLWGGPETLIVVSSDLSHFRPHDEAERVDHDTVDRILRGDLLDSFEQACGALPIDGLLIAARRHGLTARLVARCTSGDTAGDRQRVVGYAAIEFLESPTPRMDPPMTEPVTDARPDDAAATGDRGSVLPALARAAIADALGRPHPAVRADARLEEKGACFVTLKQDGQLRGCIGSLVPRRSLIDDVTANARAAAFADPRFAPLGADELDRTRISVSVLSALEPLPVRSKAEALERIRPHVDGLVLEYRDKRGTLLPQVWDALPDPRDFLSQLALKAGLAADFWSDDIRLSRYHVDTWSEP